MQQTAGKLATNKRPMDTDEFHDPFYEFAAATYISRLSITHDGQRTETLLLLLQQHHVMVSEPNS